MHRFIFSTCVLVALAVSLPSAMSQSFSVVNIGTSSTHPSPRALDDQGHVAGLFTAPTKPPQTHAFLWSKSGGSQDLGTLGGNDSSGFGVNTSGQVVGQSSVSSGGTDQPFLWTRSGGMVSLGSLGGSGGAANAINTSGQIAGASALTNGFMHGFFWNGSDGLTDIGILSGGQQSMANAINSGGTIAGWANIGTNDHAIMWSMTDGLVDLGFAAKCGSTAFGINDSSEVVGWYNNSGNCSFTSHAFSWTHVGGLQDLGVLSGGEFSFAYGINANGLVVGTGDSSTAADRALLWTADGTIHDLNALIASGVARILTAANAINDYGQVVVDATSKTGTGNYALLLTPIMSTTVASSQDPSTPGESITFTATVSSIVGPPSDGESVTFKLGTVVLGTASLSNGEASVTTATLTVGQHRIIATYAGDSVYATSKSLPLTQLVTK